VKPAADGYATKEAKATEDGNAKEMPTQNHAAE